MTTPLRVPRSRWSTKQYILAALVGMLATVAVVAAISISLAPAHIAFFVRDANRTEVIIKNITRGNQQLSYFNWYYNLTLVANNPSRRTAVSYGSLTVNIWLSETAWILADEVNPFTALPPGNTALVNFSVVGGQYDEATPTAPNGAKTSPPPSPSPKGSSSVTGVAKWPYCRVVVEAKVWFRFAGVPTLPYTVKVSCFPVNFLAGISVPVNCTG